MKYPLESAAQFRKPCLPLPSLPGSYSAFCRRFHARQTAQLRVDLCVFLHASSAGFACANVLRCNRWNAFTVVKCRDKLSCFFALHDLSGPARHAPLLGLTGFFPKFFAMLPSPQTVVNSLCRQVLPESLRVPHMIALPLTVTTAVFVVPPGAAGVRHS